MSTGLLTVAQLPNLASLDVDDCEGITHAARVSVAHMYTQKNPGP